MLSTILLANVHVKSRLGPFGVMDTILGCQPSLLANELKKCKLGPFRVMDLESELANLPPANGHEKSHSSLFGVLDQSQGWQHTPLLMGM